MRDDLAALNIGQADAEYKRDFFWRSYRDIEMFMTRVLSKGPVEVSNLVADTATIGTFTVTRTISGTLTTDGQILLTNTNDASLTSTDHPFQIGQTNSLNVIFDGDEIMARNNGAVSTLTLNAEGGPVVIGGPVTAGAITSTGLSTFNAQNLRLKDPNNAGLAAQAYLGFHDMNNVRQGYIGDGSAISADIQLSADIATLALRGQTGVTLTATTGNVAIASTVGNIALSTPAAAGEITFDGKIARASLWETIVVTDVTTPVASVAFTNLGAYRQLRLTGTIRGSASGAVPLLRVGYNNGVSYDYTATNYHFHYHVTYGPNVTAAYASGTAYLPVGVVAVGQNIDPPNTWACTFDIQMEDFNQVKWLLYLCQAGWRSSDATTVAQGTYFGTSNVSTVRNAFQIMYNTGNVTQAYFHLEGVRG